MVAEEGKQAKREKQTLARLIFEHLASDGVKNQHANNKSNQSVLKQTRHVGFSLTNNQTLTDDWFVSTFPRFFSFLCWLFLDSSLFKVTHAHTHMPNTHTTPHKHTHSQQHAASFTTKTEPVPCCCRGGSATLAKPRGQLLSRANTSHTHTHTSVFQSSPLPAL